ncbi:hypothetical protein QR685DRAFT_529574 [Neurospora intermedia]|uniref:Secreted protein n=1 Tax=Neurospora intermedia TaxID=5142 RepID=A0ABR3D9W4_NEUIN
MSRYIVLGSWFASSSSLASSLSRQFPRIKQDKRRAPEAPTFVVLIPFATSIRATPCPEERHGIH